AGLAVAIAVMALFLPVHSGRRGRLALWWSRRWDREVALAAATAWRRIDAPKLLAAHAAAAVLAGLCAAEITGLAALSVAAAAGGAAGVRVTARMRAASLQRARQDGILEAVRLLRQLLETGGVGVQQGLAVLADRGPAPLRSEFGRIVAAGVAGRQSEAWAAA